MPIDVWLGILAAVMGGLGGIVSAHAPQKLWQKLSYGVAFFVLAGLSIALLKISSDENREAQRSLQSQLNQIQQNTLHPPIVQVTVPAPVIIREPSKRSESEGGFLQLDRIDYVADAMSLEINKAIMINLHFHNRGALPVNDAKLIMGITYAIAKSNSDSHVQEISTRDLRKALRQKLHGSLIAVGADVWSTAVSQPLSAEQLNGLANGDGKLYLLGLTTWVGADNKTHEWPVCQWISNVQPNTTLTSVAWRFCE